MKESITELLKNLFSKHIGKDEALDREAVYDAVFGKGSFKKHNTYETYFNWTAKILHSMHNLRKKTKYFIIEDYNYKKRKHVYFIIQSDEELERFRNRMGKLVKGIHKTVQRAEKAVYDKFWKDIKPATTNVAKKSGKR